MSAGSFVDEMAAEGHPVYEWSNGPGYRYDTHSHSYRKVLCCMEGSIVFHLPDRDARLSAGDRLVVERCIQHSATVGPSGVRCAEAHTR